MEYQSTRDPSLRASAAEAVLNGLAVAGTDAQNNRDSVRETVNNWLDGLGY